MNSKLKAALIGALTGGGVASGAAGYGGLGPLNALKFGLVGAIPGAAIGALLAPPDLPEEKKYSDLEHLYFNYPPSLQSMYADYTREG